MAAIDVMITLIIIIKIIDIIVTIQKKKARNQKARDSQPKSNTKKVFVIVAIILLIAFITDTKRAGNQAPTAPDFASGPKPPAGIYMQPIVNITTGIITKMGQDMIKNTKKEKARTSSVDALTQAQKESREFNAQYKKPHECHTMNDITTRMNCANAYIKARRDFLKN